MSISPDNPLALTAALRNPETSAAAIAALVGTTEKTGIEGLLDLLHGGLSAALIVAAVKALGHARQPIVLDSLTYLLDSHWPSVRTAAIEAIRPRLNAEALPAGQWAHLRGEFARLATEDESWNVRRHALWAWLDLLSEPTASDLSPLAAAADDPHWRVRHALIEKLQAEPRWQTILEPVLGSLPGNPRVQGFWDYLRWRWSGDAPPTIAAYRRRAEPVSVPWWNWDSAVLGRNLDEMTVLDRRQALEHLAELAGHDDEQVHRRAADSLLRLGEPEHLLAAARVLDDPRRAAAPAVWTMLGRLDAQRKASVVALALQDGSPGPGAWALDQLVQFVPADGYETKVAELVAQRMTLPVAVRRALAELAGRWPTPVVTKWLGEWLNDPDKLVRWLAARGLSGNGAAPDGWWGPLLMDVDPRVPAVALAAGIRSGNTVNLESATRDWSSRVRSEVATVLAAKLSLETAEAASLAALEADDHPQVRAAALTRTRAQQIVAQPELESSWMVIACAATMSRKPIWEFEPGESPPLTVVPPLACVAVEWPASGPAQPRLLGLERLVVSALGVSGHYGLPEEGFARAIERGVNLFFWEPNYDTLTRFAGRLAASDRSRMHFIAGTFAAEPAAIRRDAERALRRLKIERLALFLLYWTRDWTRVNDEVRRTLDDLRQSGAALMGSLSTHSRHLAVEAIDSGWNPVMVRHSAAHRGAEEQIFARAAAAGTSLITFNNTCYGRLLAAENGSPPVAAADCYRYSLSFPAVTACLTAPATLQQLEENLSVLADPQLPAARVERMRDHGNSVYRHDCVFRELVRDVP